MSEEEIPSEFESIRYRCVRCGMIMTLSDIMEERSIMTGAVQCSNCDYPMLEKIISVTRKLKAT